MNKLTARQSAFCAEYLVDLNGTQAAIRAGYSVKGAHVQAAQLLSNAKVSSHLQKLMDARADRVQRNADDVLKDIQKVKESCMSEAFDQQGNAVMVDAKAALKALELEGRHLKMFTDKIEHSGKIGLEAMIAAAGEE